jgi:hypothetical protein
MITIKKLMEDTNSALCNLFTKVVNGVKIEPEVYDHTDEIFLDGEDGVSVWCDIPKNTLKFFKGTTNVIINADDSIVCANVFFGDKCIDTESAENLCDGLDLGSWEVEDLDDYLMLATDFPVTANLEEELSKRFGEFLDEGFAGEIKELISCFK